MSSYEERRLRRQEELLGKIDEDLNDLSHILEKTNSTLERFLDVSEKETNGENHRTRTGYGRKPSG